MDQLLTVSNATKAQVLALANSFFVLLLAFGVPLDNVQIAAILGVINAGWFVIVAFTYRLSAKRKPDVPG